MINSAQCQYCGSIYGFLRPTYLDVWLNNSPVVVSACAANNNYNHVWKITAEAPYSSGFSFKSYTYIPVDKTIVIDESTLDIKNVELDLVW